MWSLGEVAVAVCVAALGGGMVGIAVASWLAAGRRADDGTERAAEALRVEADHARALLDAEKRGYDNGWDARDLLEKRKRQAAARQAVETRRKKGTTDAA